MTVFYNRFKPFSYSLLRAVLVFALMVSIIDVPASSSFNRLENEEDAICGVWFTNNHNSKVEIYNRNGIYFGKIIWLKDPNKFIYTNKLVILDMTYNPSRQKWDNGTLYYPVKDAQYKGFMELQSRDTLLIRAYLGSPYIGKTITWVRAK